MIALFSVSWKVSDFGNPPNPMVGRYDDDNLATELDESREYLKIAPMMDKTESTIVVFLLDRMTDDIFGTRIPKHTATASGT